MVLELAEHRPYNVPVRSYDRSANHVRGYRRRRPMNDSSLFSFRLSELSTQRIVSVFLTVPDPDNKQSPRQVRLDMFDELPADEFQKLLMYVEPFNPPEVIDAAIDRRMCLADDPVIDPSTIGPAKAAPLVVSIFKSQFSPAIQPTSFWNQEFIPGIPNKFAIPGAFVLYKLLF